jgi:hypothetical protein
VTSLTAAAPRALATHCPDFIISAKSPLLFGPIPAWQVQTEFERNEYIYRPNITNKRSSSLEIELKYDELVDYELSLPTAGD